MAGIRMYQEQLPLRYPHSFAALQKLVMAMADISKDVGKTTWFGKDKGAIAYEKFYSSLKQTIIGMMLDGEIIESSSVDDVVRKLGDMLHIFSLAYPNWNDAYNFANGYFDPSRRKEYTAVINRLLST